MALDKPLEIKNREGLSSELGLCSNCGKCTRDTRVQEFIIGGVRDLKSNTFRLCVGCRTLLSGILQKPMKPLPAPDRDSPEWSQRAYSLALEHAPNIYPCKKCGWPVVDGVVCSCGSSADRNLEPFSE